MPPGRSVVDFGECFLDDGIVGELLGTCAIGIRHGFLFVEPFLKYLLINSYSNVRHRYVGRYST